MAALSDNRIRLMNEIIRGMQVIKMYAWEKHFSSIISEARRYVQLLTMVVVVNKLPLYTLSYVECP